MALHSLVSPDTGQPLNSSRASGRLGYGLIILVIAVLVGLTSFSGLENHPLYSGEAIQAIERDSFPGDEYMSRNRPVMMSLYYRVFVPLAGRLWLDDRFLLVLNCVLALGSLAGLDRLLVAFGLRNKGPRLIILCMLSVCHDTVNSLAFIVNPFEFNPTAIVRPFSIWMLYFAIVDRRAWKWIVLGVIVAGISIKNAWMPWLMCLVLYTGRFSLRSQAIISGELSLQRWRACLSPTRLLARLIQIGLCSGTRSNAGRTRRRPIP